MSATNTGTIDFGLDLGTTNSSIAVCRDGEVRVFQTTDLMNVTPSVVYLSRTGRMLVGKKAYDAWVQDPANTQAEFKRWMGFNDTLEFPASGRRLSAEDLSAEVLKALRADAERATQERVTAAVITVPAAFGSLQCDATGRAARLAGLEESPLLQEPIAAAVAYGATPASRDQRWMVFDLGGGTLDIAVVSTRNGRLAVLEHQGDNRLGGKDVDRLIAEGLLLAPLAATFKLPDPVADPAGCRRLMRALTRHAEQAKIALSTAAEVPVDLFDLGDDADGTPMELSLTLKRSDVESRVAPVVEQCLALARRALAGARLTGADLDRVLLVGGPTQMPVVRAALTAELGAKLDHSLDPMTVVARGAALYASTIERTTTPSAVTAPSPASPVKSAAPATMAAPVPAAAGGPVRVELAFERASGTRQSPVAGVLTPPDAAREVKVDAGGGFWTSGWVPVVDGAFQVDVMLHDARPVTAYALSARDAAGRDVPVAPAAFSIAYMLPMAAPPLPHTIAIELSTVQGVTTFDPVFARHTPLPAEVRKTYRAERTLRPSDAGASLPIKFWEVEVSDDPQEKWWAGCVHLRADRVKRPVPEGADLELTVRIDTSRRMTVELFVPLLNQSIADDVYVPDPPAARSQLQSQLDVLFERLGHARQAVYASDDDALEALVPELDALQVVAEDVAERAGVDARQAAFDPDAALGATEALRRALVRLSRVEEQLGVRSTPVGRKLTWAVPQVGRVVAEHGSDLERREFGRLEGQYQRYLEAGDARGLKYVWDGVWQIHWSIVEEKPWYWRDLLARHKRAETKFVNRAEADRLIAEAEQADARGDLAALRSACRRARALWPEDKSVTADEQASQSGLRQT